MWTSVRPSERTFIETTVIWRRRARQGRRHCRKILRGRAGSASAWRGHQGALLLSRSRRTVERPRARTETKGSLPLRFGEHRRGSSRFWAIRRKSNPERRATAWASVIPPLELGLPFAGAAVGAGYFGWPKLPELLPVSFPGCKLGVTNFLLRLIKPRSKCGSTLISTRPFRMQTCGRDIHASWQHPPASIQSKRGRH